MKPKTAGAIGYFLAIILGAHVEPKLPLWFHIGVAGFTAYLFYRIERDSL